MVASSGADAYSTTATVTFTWGGAAPTGNAKGWTSSGVNTLTTLTPSTYFSSLTGNNSNSYFDADFATGSDYDPGTKADDCLTPEDDGIAQQDPPEASDYDTIQLRRYGCRVSDSTGYNSPLFKLTPVQGTGPAASATGGITITDTTITGTLTVNATTDEAGGATGFNYRSADGSPFGNVWYGVSSTATITLNLTGTFTGTTWEITGGTARLEDPSFQCQQGGFGGSAPGFILCNPSTVAGGFQNNGAALSWGWDLDGAGTGTAMGPIQVFDTAGANLVATLQGVLASLTLDGGGNITTVTGEYRSGLGSSGSGCPTSIRWSGSAINCGTLTAAPLVITGTAVPVVDTTPDPFAFIDLTNVPLGAVLTSNTVTIAGIAAASAISVTGGEYSIGCSGTFTAAAGTISNGQAVCVRHTSAPTSATTVNTVLTVGGVSDTFTSTTLFIPDTTPSAFAFSDQSGVPLTTQVTSNSVTITGINTLAPISVTGAASSQYSINGGPFTSAAGTVGNGSTVRVRHTSSIIPDTAESTVLNVGGVTDTFTSTTIRYAFDDVATTPINTPAVIPVLQNDLGFPAPVYAGIWVDPLHGTAAVSGSPGAQSGIAITYTPSPGYSGPDSFEYWVEGGSVVDYGLVTVSVINNDVDGDGAVDTVDNCPLAANPGQQDSDGDGVGNVCDNCTERANANQRDTNGDGYGNICDADLNNTGLVTAADYAIFRARINTSNADADFNGSGVVTALDYSILRSYLNLPPGPSGLACAGTIPCNPP